MSPIGAALVAASTAAAARSVIGATGGGGAVGDGDYGDVVVTDDGATWTIDALAVGTTKIAANAVTGAKIFRGTTAGQVLTSNGTGSDPTYQDAAGGSGSIPQILAMASLRP